MTPSTQEKIPIKEVRNNISVLKNNNLRAILMASSVNFGLKSIDEQDVIIYQFQEFLNSLDFPVQILAASRELNILPYINLLDKKAREQQNELLRIQTEEYKEFIKELVKITNIMTKTFYVVIPFDTAFEGEGVVSRMLHSFQGENRGALKESEFERLSNQLWQRVDFVANALTRVGIKTVLLQTEDLIELFYDLFNPGATKVYGLDKTTIEELIASNLKKEEEGEGEKETPHVIRETL